ncbi:phosphoribosylanthranilate isomerase [Pseudoxanthomonas sp. CAU 1598]|uniref:N-(5'-phosphoribosyl)anthranilate isomerase n=2 Tax=Pseudomarimonas arenosa TaxID=2774145 RepID=A0AAW3ZPE5_9GAMM|nr:phosphoribosylanthranilate isomerase [Pseudomarimonas arenosa]MBD8527986.1 phosphoribosylanthranilate isomerase [Pseudomarimonas arenosa]
MRRAEDVDRAVALGVDAIGLIMVPGTPRALSLDQAAQLRARVPALVSCVALVMDADRDWLRAVLDQVRPDLLQFHGQESEAQCADWQCPYLKAIPMADPEVGLEWMQRYPSARGLVLDAHGVGETGGLGRAFDWRRVPRSERHRLILAGGITPASVGVAIAELRPFALDVSSGIESAPGEKSAELMSRFVEAVRSADAA